jgi:heme oxygenase
MGLREATSELHSKAEKMEFNQRMFRGELSTDEYVKYLYQQLMVFEAIEAKQLPHPSLARVDKVKEDLLELNSSLDKMNGPLSSTMMYSNYLSSLTQEERLPHVYLNYLALAYGGQMMKKNVPGSGKMYDFENMHEAVGAIRATQKDEWADEVNKGFQFIINIADELQNATGLNS